MIAGILERFMFCLPWYWLTIRFSKNGGFVLDIEKHNPDGFYPDLIAYIEFMPHRIQGMYWHIPNTPYDWKLDILIAYEELVEWLEKKLRTHS